MYSHLASINSRHDIQIGAKITHIITLTKTGQVKNGVIQNKNDTISLYQNVLLRPMSCIFRLYNN